MYNIRSVFSYFVLASAVVLFLPFSSCKDEPVKPEEKPGEKPDISVLVEEITCTFSWVRIRTSIPSEMKLFRNDSLILQLNTSPLDTLIFDEGLLPGLLYKYKLQLVYNDKTYETETVIESLNTTSHNFTWQSLTFGDYNHSYLKDIAIIDENNIWAVGAIYMNDSSGQGDTNAYNAIHWNGESWEIKRIYDYGACSSGVVIYSPLLAIWALSPDNIIMTNGASVGWFDGDTIRVDCRMNLVLNGAINKIWASSGSNVYLVGNSGSIVHYDGSEWTKIQSGTTVDLKYIYGTPDGKIIWIGGNTTSKTALLKIENNRVSKVFDGSGAEMINGRYVGNFESVWTNSDFGAYYMKSEHDGYCGTFTFCGIEYQRSDLSLLNGKRLAGNIYSELSYAYSLRGTAANDIFVAMESGLMGYFNGIEFQISTRNPSVSLLSVDKKNNIIAAAGDTYQNNALSKAVIILGKE